MAIERTFAEMMIRRWLGHQGVPVFLYTLTMNGNEGTVKHINGDTLTLVYDADLSLVYEKDK